MAEVLVPTGGSQPDPFAVALGLVTWAFPPEIISSSEALTSGTIYTRALFLPAGKTVSDVWLDVEIAGAGMAPTGFYVGICSTTTMLGQSGNLNGNAGLTATGIHAFPLSASYTSEADGLCYALALEVGGFGTTSVQFGRGGNTFEDEFATAVYMGSIGTGKTAMPANGSAVTVTPGGPALFVALS